MRSARSVFYGIGKCSQYNSMPTRMLQHLCCCIYAVAFMLLHLCCCILAVSGGNIEMKDESEKGIPVRNSQGKNGQKQAIIAGSQGKLKAAKRYQVWMILFAVLILHYFLFPHIYPSHDLMGQEGLKRVIVQGIAILPAMFCMAVTILAEGILWLRQNRRKIADMGKWMIWSWVFVFCVNVWWCGMETRNLLHAVQDWKLVEETDSGKNRSDISEQPGIDCVSFQSWKIQKTSSMGVTRGYYLKNAARTFSFPIGKDLQRKQDIESYADQELTVYYYHYSHVPVQICAGEQIIAGE